MYSAPRSTTGEPDEPPSAVQSERKVQCALDVAAASWLLQANDLDGARRVLESALVLQPHDVRARALLAQVLFRRREFIAASEVYERLLGEFRGDLSLAFNLALSQLKSGRIEAAASGLRAILAARPEHERARSWLRVAEAATPSTAPGLMTPASLLPTSLSPAPVAPAAAAPAPASTAPQAPAAPSTRPPRASVRPNRLDELPRVTLPPGTEVAQDATGVVSVRVGAGSDWLARPEALQGYAGSVTFDPRPTEGNGFVSLTGTGTAFLRTGESLVVIELCDEEACVRASSIVAYATTLVTEATDPEVVGEFDEGIFRFSGRGAIVIEARAELVALPVSLTHATTVRWEHVVGWTGHVIGAPSDADPADEPKLARFAGNGSLLLAMHDAPARDTMPDGPESYGRYQVIERLDGTPVEEVLLARANGPGGFQRKVILKRHVSRYEGDSRSLQLLAREAHAYALLTHSAVARLYDFVLLDGHPVLVHEYVSGVSLAALVAALAERGRAVGGPIALYIAHGLFSALAAAHDAREPDTGELAPVVHGDVRPANVRLGWNGDVKLAGFVSAKLGESAYPVTEETDVRVAALLLYELMTRQSAVEPSLSELELAMTGIELDPLAPPRVPLRFRLHDALRLALFPVADGVGVLAVDLANAIEAVVDLPFARALCVQELASLRESAFGDLRKSSRPPPAPLDGDDSGFFGGFRVPPASPVPVLAPAPVAAASASYDTPPPIQLASMDPAPVDAPRLPRRGRRVATAVGIGAVVLSTGILSIEWAPSSRPPGRAAAAAEPSAAPHVAIVTPSPVPSAPPAPSASDEVAPAIPSVEASAPDASAAAPIVSGDGTLRTPARALQHRIFFDGRVIGEGTGEYRVPCGAHSVRVGSQGDEISIVIPCGGSIAVE